MRYGLAGSMLAFGLMALTGQPANAGVVQVSDQTEILEAVASEMLSSFNPETSPLLSASMLPADVGGVCERDEPAVHALLLAGRDIYRNELDGPENDVDLLRAALESRAPGAANISVLSGELLRREQLRDAMLDVVGQAQCGDQVFLHFGGQSFPGAEMLKMIGGYLFEGDDASVDDALQAGRNFSGTGWNGRDEVARVLAEPFLLVMNKDDAGRMELVSGTDITTFVTMVRNRGADVVITLDSPFADRASIAAGQAAAGDTTQWSLQSLDTFEPPALRLLPQHGEFFAIYGSVGNFASVDKRFRAEDGESTVFGAFTFELAKLLQDPAAVTARFLGERIAAIPRSSRAADGVYKVEGSDPAMLLFASDTRLKRDGDAIRVLSPEPTRGPSAVQSSSIDVTGLVDWTSPPIAVLIDGAPAELQSDGRFRGTVNLRTGANTVNIVALTRDDRLLQRELEIVFDGDVRALRGGGRNYAVIIANATYESSTGFGPLITPHTDADALEAVLVEDYGFATEAVLPDGRTANLSLRDATARDISMALYHVGLVAGPEDTVLIFYAGHGIFEPMTTTAFWVPVDAVAGVPPTYVSASSISEAIARMQSKKVMLVSDSCFSGALLRGQDAAAPDRAAASEDRVKTLLALAGGKTRLLLSSGNNEPVTDGGGSGHSIFARALLDGLNGMEHDQFTARELFDDFIVERVIANSRQEPQWRPLEDVGHEGGDVVFVRTSG
jgi:hypothetical protein